MRVSGGVSTHGFALNVNTDLSRFHNIIPCGLAGVGVTSMRQLTGETFGMRAVENQVVAAFSAEFGFEREAAMAGAMHDR